MPLYHGLVENRKPTQAERMNQGMQSIAQQAQQYQQQQQTAKALQQMGVDPSVMHAPPEAQAAYFKQQFAPEKTETALQQSQRQLNEEKLNALKGNQKLFDKLRGGGQQEQASQGQMPQESSSPGLEQADEATLREISAFAGQPGQEGTLGNMAKSELERREKQENIKRKSFEEERVYHTQFSKKAEEEVENLRNNLSKKEMSLNLSRDAVESGEVGAFSLANLAQRLDMPELQTMKGAQLETAIKENLLSNMSRVSAKGQNIWFEKRLNSMMAQIGKSKEANLAAQEVLEGEVAMDQAYLENFDRLSQEDMQKYNFVKKDISKRAHDAAKYQEKEIFKRTSYRLKELEEQEKGFPTLKKQVGKNVSKGTPLTLAMAKLYKEKFGDNALQVAEKNGYYIPSLEEFQTFRASPQEFREGLQ